jgi:hypothetical protein
MTTLRLRGENGLCRERLESHGPFRGEKRYVRTSKEHSNCFCLPILTWPLRRRACFPWLSSNPHRILPGCTTRRDNRGRSHQHPSPDPAAVQSSMRQLNQEVISNSDTRARTGESEDCSLLRKEWLSSLASPGRLHRRSRKRSDLAGPATMKVFLTAMEGMVIGISSSGHLSGPKSDARSRKAKIACTSFSSRCSSPATLLWRSNDYSSDAGKSVKELDLRRRPFAEMTFCSTVGLSFPSHEFRGRLYPLGATPGGYTGKSGRAKRPYFTGLS